MPFIPVWLEVLAIFVLLFVLAGIMCLIQYQLSDILSGRRRIPELAEAVEPIRHTLHLGWRWIQSRFSYLVLSKLTVKRTIQFGARAVAIGLLTGVGHHFGESWLAVLIAALFGALITAATGSAETD